MKRAKKTARRLAPSSSRVQGLRREHSLCSLDLLRNKIKRSKLQIPATLNPNSTPQIEILNMNTAHIQFDFLKPRAVPKNNEKRSAVQEL